MGATDQPEEFVFRSKLPDIHIPDHLPLHKYCFENIASVADRTCIIDGSTGEHFTYAQVEVISRRVAAGLNNIGINKGDVIMILLHNCPQFVFAFLGASYRGAVSTTANPFYTSTEIAKQAVASKAKLIITTSGFAGKVKDFAESNKVKVACVDFPPDWCLSFNDLVESDEKEMVEVEIDSNDVVALPYSSGTTGMPKGVMLTHKGLVTSVAQQVDGDNPNLYFSNKDVIMCVLPMFHIYSLNSILLCGLRSGATVLIMHKFEIESLMELVERYHVTVGTFVPPIVLAIAKSASVDQYDLSSIRIVMSGAAPLGKDLEDAVRTKLPNCKLGQAMG